MVRACCSVPTARTYWQLSRRMVAPFLASTLIRAIGFAFTWRRELLKTGRSITSVAREAGVTRARVNSLLMIAQLSPSLLRSALQGELGTSISLEDLIRAAHHLDWSRQAQHLGR